MGDPANIWQPSTITEISANTKSVEEAITAIAAQTLFTVNSFEYVLGTGALEVHQNGLLLTKNVDWSEATSTSFILAAGANVDDVLVASAHVGITATIELDRAPWQVIIAAQTIINEDKLMCNTTASAYALITPLSPNNLSTFKVCDYLSTWDTNNVILTYNGVDKINGEAQDFTLNTENLCAKFDYIDVVVGWKQVG